MSAGGTLCTPQLTICLEPKKTVLGPLWKTHRPPLLQRLTSDPLNAWVYISRSQPRADRPHPFPAVLCPSTNRVVSGIPRAAQQKVFTHESKVTNCTMKFGIFLPAEVSPA